MNFSIPYHHEYPDPFRSGQKFIRKFVHTFVIARLVFILHKISHKAVFSLAKLISIFELAFMILISWQNIYTQLHLATKLHIDLTRTQAKHVNMWTLVDLRNKRESLASEKVYVALYAHALADHKSTNLELMQCVCLKCNFFLNISSVSSIKVSVIIDGNKVCDTL